MTVTPTPARPVSSLDAYIALTRPFTLVMPALGMLTGGIIALRAAPPVVAPWVANPWARIALGTLMAALLNSASNVLNQVYDLDIDRINKPDRILPRGLMPVPTALRYSAALYALALGCSVLVGPACAAIVAVTAFLTWAYSAPPFRWKRLLWFANLVVAVPRGMLLKVAGWSAVGSIFAREAWYIGAIFAVFLFGAMSTKDFSDVEGDRRFGCVTLPIHYGVHRAATLIAPFFFAPTVLIGLGLWAGWLSGNPRWLVGLALLMAVWGAYAVRLMFRHQDALLADANQASWTHMYLMSFALQIGFAVAYVV